MRKLILVSALFLGLATISHAQVGFSAGVKGGLNFSQIEGDNVNDIYETRTGYNAGAFVNIKIQRLGIQPEVMFSSQGSKLDLNQSTIHKFNYINIPVLVKFYPVDFLSLQAGPQFGFMSSAKQIIDNATEDITTIYKDSDISLALGIGLELPFGLNVEGRYNVGVSDINDDPNTADLLKNQVYQVSVGFRFLDLGK